MNIFTGGYEMKVLGKDQLTYIVDLIDLKTGTSCREELIQSEKLSRAANGMSIYKPV